ncbi:MAG TPA: pirin-like C-terminal cupin domain-containing protein [Puia sp.]|nr:pirin-like C-terminal cupin domain-containing protein [Puia sp.]
MSINRKLVKIDTPRGEPGFLGAGHTARPLLSGSFSETDPFIMLMDDVLDKKDNVPVGGPHPHAGFETVSFLLEGEIGDEAHKMRGGDFQIMTAGSGIVHTETIDKIARLRLLQLWLNLPSGFRWATPRVQDLQAEHAPAFRESGVLIILYSGSLNDLRSPVQNYTPLIVADIRIDPKVATTQQIPGNFNSFLYVLQGSVSVGEPGIQLKQGQVGWLDLSNAEDQSELILTAGEDGVRLVLYGGKPTGENIVSYGPFIADNAEDIQRLYREYSKGKMEHISRVPAAQRILY